MDHNTDSGFWRILTVDDESSIHNAYVSTLNASPDLDIDSLLDNPDLALYPDQQPADSQFQIEHAYSGEQAVEMVQQGLTTNTPYAVILLDMRMPPGWDGLETAKQIRAIDPEVRIILISAYMGHSLVDLRREIGLNFEYLSKPFDPDELYQLVLAQASSWSRFLKLSALSNEYQQTSNKLRQSNSELFGLREAINQHAIVSMANTDGEIIYVNDKMCEVSGYTQQELLGENHRILNSGQHPPEFFKEMWETISCGSSWSGDIRNMKKGGQEYYWVRSTITPFKNPAGDIIKYVSIRTEITNMVEANAKISLSKEKLEAAIASRDNFFASMSHELRTPLTLILGNCELAQEENPESALMQLLNGIESATNQQLSLVNDILDMANIESGTFVLTEESYDPELLLKQIHQSHLPAAKESEISLTLHQHAPFPSKLIGDPTRIEKIIRILLNNAIKFTKSGEVSIHLSHDEKQLEICVEDSGIGIDPDFMETLFQRFGQEDDAISRRFGGAGLGLYLAHNLTRMMRGSIDVSSTKGVGSRFQLHLPYRAIEPVVAEPSSAKQNKTGSGQLISGTILYAEDAVEMQLLVRKILEAMGATVTLAENGQEAIELAQAHRFDLILMDMQMPIIDGIEATQRIRNCGIETPIVALTANVMQKNRDQFTQAGASDFLSKPINRELLTAVVQRYLNPVEHSQSEQSSFEVSEELLHLYLERLSQQQMDLLLLTRDGEWEKVQEIARNIKGSAPTFGFDELGKLADRLFQNIELQQRHKTPELSITLMQKISQIRKHNPK